MGRSLYWGPEISLDGSKAKGLGWDRLGKLESGNSVVGFVLKGPHLVRVWAQN